MPKQGVPLAGVSVFKRGGPNFCRIGKRDWRDAAHQGVKGKRLKLEVQGALQSRAGVPNAGGSLPRAFPSGTGR